MNAEPDTPGIRKRRLLMALALLAALAYVAVAVATDASRLRTALWQLGWLGSGAVLSMSALNYILRFQRWRFYMTQLGRSLPLIPHFIYYMSGFAFTVSPAKAGEALRSVYMRAHGVAYSECIAAIFVERLVDLLAIALLASLIIAEHQTYWPLIAGVSVAVLTMLVTVCQPAVPDWIERIALRFSGRLSGALGSLARLLHASRQLLHPRPLLVGILCALAAWGAEGIGFRLICEGLHLNLSTSVAVGTYAVAALAGGAAFFLPAGIGGMEVVMTTLLVQFGAPLRVAVIATLLCRLATLWFAVILGIAASSTVGFIDRRARQSAVL